MKTVLLATDFSGASDNAADYAAQLALLFKARLLVVNAYAMPLTGFDVVPSLEVTGRIRDISEESLLLVGKTLQERYPEISVETVLRMGNPENVINQLTGEFSVGLVVMGIVSEADKIKEHLVGSTALDVARGVKVPALIVPGGVKYRQVKKISFAWVPDEEEDKNLVFKARYFCNAFSAELEIVNVENNESEPGVSKARKLEFVEENFRNLKHEALFLNDEDVVRALEDYFKWYPTDIVMLSPKKHGLFNAIFKKSVTKELAFHMKLPILVIH